MDYTKELHELCETISSAITEANEKIRAAGGKLTAGDVDYVDKLTHAMKSVKAVIGMMDEEGEGYSGNDGGYRAPYDGRSYRGSYNGGSYARGRMNARRDSMGRYSGERGYSRDGLADELRELMQEAPDERIRQEFQRLIEKLER